MRAIRIISILLHPVLMPLVGVFLLFTFGGWLPTLPFEAKAYVYLVIIVTTILMPVTLMPLMKKLKLIPDYRFAERDDRKIPLLLLAFFYLCGAFILQKANAPAIIPMFLNGLSLVILGCALVNWRWKVSIYMAALGALNGMILGLSFLWMINLQWVIALLFVLAGIAGYARLKGGHHTPAQVYGGYLIGLSINLLLLLLI